MTLFFLLRKEIVVTFVLSSYSGPRVIRQKKRRNKSLRSRRRFQKVTASDVRWPRDIQRKCEGRVLFCYFASYSGGINGRLIERNFHWAKNIKRHEEDSLCKQQVKRSKRPKKDPHCQPRDHVYGNCLKYELKDNVEEETRMFVACVVWGDRASSGSFIGQREKWSYQCRLTEPRPVLTRRFFATISISWATVRQARLPRPGPTQTLPQSSLASR